MNENNNKPEKKGVKIRPMSIIGIVLCLILLPILFINVTLIIRSYTHSDEVPSIGGIFPMIVLTDSMFPQIQSGDLIICRQSAPEDVKVGDVICFFDPDSSGTTTVTHRVIEITEKDGEVAFLTKGDANNAADRSAVPAKKLVGVYERRFPKVGNVAMFMQTTVGLIVCVVLPMIVLVAIDLLRTRRFQKKHNQDTDALMRELEELRARQAAMTAGTSAAAKAAEAKADEAPPKEEAPPEKSEEELRQELQEMGDPEPLDLDVAPAEGDLETGNAGEEIGDEIGDTGDEGGGAGEGEGGGGDA